MTKKNDLTGKKFNRLTAIRESGRSEKGEVLWLFKCDCGNEKEILGWRVKNGGTKSCGCLQREISIKRVTTHGDYGSSLHKCWQHMKQRCNNENIKGYHNWGGRGITYTPEWEEYEPFKDWALSNGYEEGLTIDRIDNDGNYEPSNCRWATRQEQANNFRPNVLITVNGRTETAAEWSRITGVNHGTILWRSRNGFTGGDIISNRNHQTGKKLV